MFSACSYMIPPCFSVLPDSRTGSNKSTLRDINPSGARSIVRDMPANTSKAGTNTTIAHSSTKSLDCSRSFLALCSSPHFCSMAGVSARISSSALDLMGHPSFPSNFFRSFTVPSWIRLLMVLGCTPNCAAISCKVMSSTYFSRIASPWSGGKVSIAAYRQTPAGRPADTF